MNLFHVNRGFIFPYHLLFCWAGKHCAVDKGLCSLSSKVTHFSYGYFKIGVMSVIFPLKHVTF